MKGYYELEWESKHRQPKEIFNLEWLEEEMGIKLPEDFKDFQYRNNNSDYPDWDNCKLYDKDGEVAFDLPNIIETYLGLERRIKSQEIARDDLGEIYYWHLPINICNQQRIIFDYTHCKENPPVVWVNEEDGPYEDELGVLHWKRYVAPTFKDFIEMIGDRNRPVGVWIDQNLMADGTILSDEEAENTRR